MNFGLSPLPSKGSTGVALATVDAICRGALRFWSDSWYSVGISVRAELIARVKVRLRARYERGLLALVLAISASSVASPAGAQSNAADPREPRPFRVVFSSASGCAEPAEFVEQLRGRTAHLRSAREFEPSLIFFVSLARTQAGVHGQLRVQNPDGSETTREVPGLDCREVLSAMALIAALMVDPLAITSPVLPAPAAAAAASPAPADESPAPRTGWSLSAGQRLALHTGVLPGLGWGESWFVQAGLAGSGMFQPSLRVAAHTAGSTTRAAPLGSARFRWQAARASACPLDLSPLPAFVLRPCAFFDLGRLQAWGFSTASPQNHSVFWAATGLELEFEAILIGPLVVGADAGVVLPLVPAERFHFLPENAPNAVPHVISLGVSAALGLGLRFF
jgi:hypothetical protein